jgi:excisionase family DNA binding protein
VRLRDALAALPDDALVSVGWVRTQLDAEENEAAGREVLLTVRQVAERYERSESTVRGWCAAGQLPGAFKLQGTVWRIPEAALTKFDDTQGRARSRRALGRRSPVDLEAWRNQHGA